MKQKIVVRAIIKDRKGKMLFLRRKGGRESLVGKYELPGGKLIMGEQPINAMERTLKYHTNLSASTIQLFDILTFVDPDNRHVQYLFIVFLVVLDNTDEKIILDSGYDKYIWKKKSELQQNVVTNSTKMIIGYDEEASYKKRHDNKGEFTIYTDGASRGNPGPSAAGFVILDQSEDIVVDGGRYIGIQDSVYAEYVGILLALDKASKMELKNIEIRSDSLSVVNQINGIDKIIDKPSLSVYQQIEKLKSSFSNVRFVHVRRDFNQLADGIVNNILDKAEHK